MATKFPLSVLQKELIAFDGEKESLSRFLNVCESVQSLVKPEDSTALFTLIKLKLTGKAYNLTKNRLFESWDDMKSVLEELFSEKRSQGQWELELHSSHQKKNEKVTDFATRVENIMVNLIDSVTLGETKAVSVHYEKLLRNQTKNVFIQGLQDPTKIIVKARNPESFEKAVELAVAEEREYLSQLETRKYTQNNSCEICGKNNHITKNCFRNKIKPKNVLSFQSDKFCKYCKNKGHLIEECRKKRYNEERKKSLNGQGPSGVGNQKESEEIKADKK